MKGRKEKEWSTAVNGTRRAGTTGHRPVWGRMSPQPTPGNRAEGACTATGHGTDGAIFCLPPAVWSLHGSAWGRIVRITAMPGEHMPWTITRLIHIDILVLIKHGYNRSHEDRPFPRQGPRLHRTGRRGSRHAARVSRADPPAGRHPARLRRSGPVRPDVHQRRPLARERRPLPALFRHLRRHQQPSRPVCLRW